MIKNKLTNITVVTLLIIALITWVINIFITNTTALDSITATKLENKIAMFSEANTDLQDKVLTLSSFQNIASRSAELGYSDTKDLVSVYDPVKVAVSR